MSKIQFSSTDICPFCKKEVVIIEGKIYRNKCYHIKCYENMTQKALGKKEQQKTEEEIQLYKYIEHLFHLPIITSNLKKQVQEYLTKGITYEGMLKTLIYVYDILQIELPHDCDYPTIKIIEYRFDEAKDFWEHKEKLMEKYKNIDIKTFITEKHMKTSQQYKKEKKELKYIDIDANIIEEQEEPISQEDKQKIIDYQKTLQEIKNEFEKNE